jgi:hypothetical protein
MKKTGIDLGLIEEIGAEESDCIVDSRRDRTSRYGDR